MNIIKKIIGCCVIVTSMFTYANLNDTIVDGDKTFGRVGSFDKDTYVMMDLGTNEIHRLDLKIDEVAGKVNTNSASFVVKLLTNEIYRATNAETNLFKFTTNEIGKLDLKINTITNNISTNSVKFVIEMVTNEVNRAVNAETNLFTLITNEQNRAFTCETNLYVQITNEEFRAVNAETNLYTSITNLYGILSTNTSKAVYTKDIRSTCDIGVHKIDPVLKYVDLAFKGKTIQEAMEYLLIKRMEPGNPTNPSITDLKLNGESKNEIKVEVGKLFTPSYTISFSTGSYDYGPSPTGSTFDYFTVGDGTHTTNKQSASFNSFYVQDNTSYRISATGHYTDGYYPYDNTGVIVSNDTKKICAGTTSQKYTVYVTGYRNWYTYVGTSLETIDSNFIKNNATSRGNGKSASTLDEVEIPSGTKRVLVCIPENYTKELTSVIDVDGMGLDIFSKFTKITVSVDAATTNAVAANYSVWKFENDKGVSATHFKFVISDVTRSIPFVKAGPSPAPYPDYSAAVGLNIALTRQFDGPMDVSELFKTTNDLYYYITKGRLKTGVSEYWLNKVPYPFAGQTVTLAVDYCCATNYVLKIDDNTGEFDLVQMSTKNELDELNTRLTKEIQNIKTNVFNGVKIKDMATDTVYTLCISNGMLMIQD